MYARKTKPCLKGPRDAGDVVTSPRYNRAGRSLTRLQAPCFEEAYRISCLEHKVDPLGYVVDGWKQGKLCLSLDGLTPEGLLALGKALRRATQFELEVLKICFSPAASSYGKPSTAKQQPGRASSAVRKPTAAAARNSKKSWLGGGGGARVKRPLDVSLLEKLFQGLQHHLASLRRLEVTNVPLSKPACLSLMKGLAHCKQLDYFSLSGCQIGDSVFVELAPILQRLPALVTLDVCGCELTDRSGVLLKDVILAHQDRRKDFAFKRSLRSASPVKIERGVGLEHVVASGNRLGDATCTALVSALHYDDYVLTLQLSHNRITPLGAACLNRLIDYNTSLGFIDISDNLDAAAAFQSTDPAQRHFISHGPGSCIYIGNIQGEAAAMSMQRTLPVGGASKRSGRTHRRSERQSAGRSPQSHGQFISDIAPEDAGVYSHGSGSAGRKGMRQVAALPSSSSQEQGARCSNSPRHRSSRDGMAEIPAVEGRAEEDMMRTDSYEDTPTTPNDDRRRHRRSRTSPRSSFAYADAHQMFTTEDPLATLAALYGNVQDGLRVPKLNNLLKADLAVRKQYRIPQPGISGLSSVVRALSKTYKDVIPWAEFQRHVRKHSAAAAPEGGVERASLLKILHKLQRLNPEQHDKIMQRIYDGPDVVPANAVDQYFEECLSDHSTNPSSSSSPVWGASCRDVNGYPTHPHPHGPSDPTSVPEEYRVAPPPSHLPPGQPLPAGYVYPGHPCAHVCHYPVTHVSSPLPPQTVGPPQYDPQAVVHHHQQAQLLHPHKPPAQVAGGAAQKHLDPKAGHASPAPEGDDAANQPVFAWEAAQQALAAKDSHTEEELKRIELKLDSLIHTMQPNTLLVEKIQELLSRPSQPPAAAAPRGNGFSEAKAPAEGDEDGTVTSEDEDDDSSPEYEAIHLRLMERYPGNEGGDDA